MKTLLRVIRSHYSQWPRHSFAPLENEPTFLFLFTPPYSGSTALAKIFNSLEFSMVLHSNCEGQWLVPGLCQSDRWNPEKFINWRSVRSVWFSKIREVQDLVGRIDLVIEKSPPNLVRSEQLLKKFPNHDIIVFNRNPYANCASILYRLHNPDDKTEDERIEILKDLAAAWVSRSHYAKQIIEIHDPVVFTYEEFCADTANVIKAASERIHLLKGIDPELQIKVKDYALSGISDHNKRQISKLSRRELATIGDTLKEHEPLLRVFNYTSEWEKDIAEGGAGGAT